MDTKEVCIFQDNGYQIVFPDGATWTRRESDIICFADPSADPLYEGVIPKLERCLKREREQAKADLKKAKKDGNANLTAYFDTLQAGIKIVMNSLYGALGARKGGIMPDSSLLAAAITARGRQLIVQVKKIIESRFWLLRRIST